MPREWAEELQPDDTHRAIWRWLGENGRGYPIGTDVQPLKRPEGPGRAHKWGGIEIVSTDVVGQSCPLVVSVDVHAASQDQSVTGLAEGDGAARVARVLFSRSARGTAYVLGHGGRRDLHILFRNYYDAWLSLGYRITPLLRGGDCKLMTVSKDKHSWHLVDWHGLTGLDPCDLARCLTGFGGARTADGPRSIGLAEAVEGYAAFIRSTFGVEARLTLGQTAIAAATMALPDDRWLWRPTALALTLCREGGAFRGGYCYYPAYRGPGHKIDLRRAYAWALDQPLPMGSAFGECCVGGHEHPGIYVCEVRGPGCLPAYLAVWQEGQGGFTRRLWNGDRGYAVLPSAEFAGLRALGYSVTPGWGAVSLGTFGLRRLVRAAEGAMGTFGADSPQGQAAKLLVNAVYGKMAERPEREGLTFSRAAPSEHHLPYVDAAGEEVPGAWCRPEVAYRAHQHVDVAAEVTALVRGRLYTAMGRLTECGIKVLAADTDGLLLSHAPTGVLDVQSAAIGGWRYTGYDPRVTITGPRFATWLGRAMTAGTSRQAPNVVELAYDNGVVTVAGRVMAPPWQGGAIVRTVAKQLRRGA